MYIVRALSRIRKEQVPAILLVAGVLFVVLSVADIRKLELQRQDDLLWPLFSTGIVCILIAVAMFLMQRPDRRVDQDWEVGLQDSASQLDVMFADSLAEKVGDLTENPDTLLAVQIHGQWLAEFLVDQLNPTPKIISVEKDVPAERRSEYLTIRTKGGHKRPDCYIAYAALRQGPLGNVIVVDDFVSSGATVLSIIDGLRNEQCDIKAVATITVGKTHLEEVQHSLRERGVKLVQVFESGKDLYQK